MQSILVKINDLKIDIKVGVGLARKKRDSAGKREGARKSNREL